MILQATPATSEAPGPASPAGATSKAPKTARTFPADQLGQICRQLAHCTFRPADYARSYNGHTLDINSPLLPPGLYVFTVAADRALRGLATAEYYPGAVWPRPPMDIVVRNSLSDHLGYQFNLARPAVVHFRVTVWWDDTAGEVGLFELGPRGYAGPRGGPPPPPSS